MSTTKQPVVNRASLTSASLATLAAATYCVSSNKDNTANNPLDVVVELSATTTNTPIGNKQVVLFCQASYDGGTTWQSGPTSGTTTTSEPNLTWLGTLLLPTASGAESKSFSVAAGYGFLPPMVRFVTKNDLGVALTAGTLFTEEVTSTTV